MKQRRPLGEIAIVFRCLVCFAFPWLSVHGDESVRADFARALGSVTINMSPLEVERLLGKPDDVRTQLDPGGISTNHTEEIWCYGTSGRLTFPTLGNIYMKQDGVQYIHGGKGKPFDPALLNEADLRVFLQKIDALLESRSSNPLLYVQLVNQLRLLGKDTPLAIIDEYLRVSPDRLHSRIPIFNLLRLLFEVPEDPGFMPPMLVGSPSVKEPDNRKLLPQFPMVLMDDIPLNLVISYALAGVEQPVEEHLAYFRKNGRLRARPLQPSNHPLEILKSFEDSPQWIFGSAPDEGAGASDSIHYRWIKNHLGNQLLNLIRSVYQIEPDMDGRSLHGTDFDADQWDRIVQEVADLNIRWNPAENQYVFANGISLPQVKAPIHMRQIWKIPKLWTRGRMIFERKSKNDLLARLEYSTPIKHRTMVNVYQCDADRTLLTRFFIPATAETQGVQQSDYTSLPSGANVQVEIVSDGKTVTSEVMTP